jgi:hypothetical protein
MPSFVRGVLFLKSSTLLTAASKHSASLATNVKSTSSSASMDLAPPRRSRASREPQERNPVPRLRPFKRSTTAAMCGSRARRVCFRGATLLATSLPRLRVDGKLQSSPVVLRSWAALVPMRATEREHEQEIQLERKAASKQI